MNTRRRLLYFSGVCTVLCVVSVFVQIGFGTYTMTVREAWGALFDGAVWTELPLLWELVYHGEAPGLSTATLVVWTIRLPRVVAAMFVGMSLGVSGAVFQSLTRNELASPYILGVSAGAGLLVLSVLVFFTVLRPFLPLVAAAGGGMAFLGVYLIAWKGGTSPVRLVLAGVVMTAILDSLQMVLYLLVEDVGTIHSAMAWIIGSLVGVDWDAFNHAVPWLLFPFLILVASSRHLDVIALGDRTAAGLGMSVELVRFGLASGAVLLASASVTVAGTIGFIGLIVPHVARNLVGGNSRTIMVASAFCGAALLAVSDVVARLIFNPVQLPVGIVTGLIGGGYFLWLMKQQSIAGVGADTADAPPSSNRTRPAASASDPSPSVDDGGLRVEQLEIGYGEDPPVVADLSMNAPKEKLTVLVGPNGSGKSTLLRGVARQLPPRSGGVYLNGESLQQLPRRAFARRLAMLQQDHLPISDLTVEQLVMHGRYPYRSFFDPPGEDDHEAVEQALERVGITDNRHRLLGQLSGGQRQLAWLAMCLAQESEVVLLDEPTTFLDVVHQYQLMELLTRLTRDRSKTVLMVLHDLEKGLQFADHLVVLSDGQIASSGPPEDVLTPSLLDTVFQIEGKVVPGDNGPRLIVEGPATRGP